MTSRLVVSIAVALALAVAACGKGGAEEDNSAGSGSEAAVKTGPGATADTITLGYLPDLSGVFAPNGKSMMEGANLYWDAKNKAGGICGRTIEVKVQDTGYDPQKAVAAYQLAPVWSHHLIAMTLPWIELVVALALIAKLQDRAAAIVAAVAMLAFTGAVTWAWSKGLSIDCGCYGSAAPTPVGASKLLQNLGLCGLAAIAALPAKDR